MLEASVASIDASVRTVAVASATMMVDASATMMVDAFATTVTSSVIKVKLSVAMMATLSVTEFASSVMMAAAVSVMTVTLSVQTAEAFAMTFTDFANATETDVIPCNVAIRIGRLTTNTAVVRVRRDSFHFNGRRDVHRGRHKKNLLL